MAEKQTIDAMWDDSPVDVSTEVNFIWSIANKLRGTYQSDKYKDVIIPMVIIRRFECALAPTKQKVVDQFRANPRHGRTDLAGGSEETILASLAKMARVLPPETTCFIGHGPSTTITRELAVNPFMQG